MDDNRALVLLFSLPILILLVAFTILSKYPKGRKEKKDIDLIDALQREVRDLKATNGELRDDLEREKSRRKSVEYYLHCATQIREDKSKRNAYPPHMEKRAHEGIKAHLEAQRQDKASYSDTSTPVLVSSWTDSSSSYDSGCGSDGGGDSCD